MPTELQQLLRKEEPLIVVILFNVPKLFLSRFEWVLYAFLPIVSVKTFNKGFIDPNSTLS